MDEKTLCHFDVLDTSKLREAPDGEVACDLYSKMSRAMGVFPWEVVLMDAVRRNRDTGEVRQVRVTVDETEEFGLCLRHACVDFDQALLWVFGHRVYFASTSTRPPLLAELMGSRNTLACPRRQRECSEDKPSEYGMHMR